MTKDNHPLGKFELTGIPPASRGIPQIEVSFRVDSNGILEVTAEDKGTGKAEKITITSDKGRLSEQEIQRMIEEAEEYAEEDRLARERTDERNGLESYLYSLKTTLDGDETLSRNLSAEDKRDLLDLVDEKVDWMEENPEASRDDLVSQREEVEQIANPLLQRLYRDDPNGEGDEDIDDMDL